MIELLLATHNIGKVREIRRITAGCDWHWRGLDDFPDLSAAVEDADTFAGNARLKALYYAAATGLTTLADDSGLEVDCLDGAPGVHSARYAGEPKDDAANNRLLIANLKKTPLGQRTARFRCAMALARPGEILAETAGVVEGVIIDEPRGSNGFGYDPHFLASVIDKTLAELPEEEKNALSHRGQALRAMARIIAETAPFS